MKQEECRERERGKQATVNSHIISWGKIPNHQNHNMEQPGNITHLFSLTNVFGMNLYYLFFGWLSNTFRTTFRTLKCLLFCTTNNRRKFLAEMPSNSCWKWRGDLEWEMWVHILIIFFLRLITLHPLLTIIIWFQLISFLLNFVCNT